MSGGCKSEVQASPGLVPSEAASEKPAQTSVLGSPSPCGFASSITLRVCVWARIFPFKKDTCQLGAGPAPPTGLLLPSSSL